MLYICCTRSVVLPCIQNCYIGSRGKKKIFLRNVTTVAAVFATVADTLWGTGSKGSSKSPSNDAKARRNEPAIFTRKSEYFKEWLFTVVKARGIFQPMDPVGYAASFLEGSARQWFIA